MQNGSIYRRKSDKRWVAQYQDVTGKMRYIHRRTKNEAKQALWQALDARDEGIVPVGRMTLNDLLESWHEDMEGTVSRRTIVHRQSIFRVHIKPTIGVEKLSKLTHKDFQRLYRTKVSQGFAAGTVKCIHVLLKQAFGDAVKRKYISDNPLSDVKPPREDKEEKEILSPDQVRHLLESVRGHRFELAAYMGATCALRIGETLALRWEDFNMIRGTVSVQRTLLNGQVCWN